MLLKLQLGGKTGPAPFNRWRQTFEGLLWGFLSTENWQSAGERELLITLKFEVFFTAFCKTAWSDAADGSCQLLHFIFLTLQVLEILHRINIKCQGPISSFERAAHPLSWSIALSRCWWVCRKGGICWRNLLSFKSLFGKSKRIFYSVPYPWKSQCPGCPSSFQVTFYSLEPGSAQEEGDRKTVRPLLLFPICLLNMDFNLRLLMFNLIAHRTFVEIMKLAAVCGANHWQLLLTVNLRQS